MAKQKSTKSSNGATVGYEQQLWQMADALRGSMDAAEYKHVVLGLIFLTYISDAFEEQHAKLEAERSQGPDPEDPDEYRALNIFWVPPEARWSHLKAQAKQSTIGQLVDDAMSGIERDNTLLKGVLPKEYARPALYKKRLGQLIDMISNIHFSEPSSPSPLPVGEGRLFGSDPLGQRLREALVRLNPTLPDEAIDDVFRKITRLEGATLDARNRTFHRLLVDGIAVEFRQPSPPPAPSGRGSSKAEGEGSRLTYRTVKIIDFENPDANDWLAVNQFTVVENKHNRRPDVLIFVNGLPLGVVELKNTADEDATI